MTCLPSTTVRVIWSASRRRSWIWTSLMVTPFTIFSSGAEKLGHAPKSLIATPVRCSNTPYRAEPSGSREPSPTMSFSPPLPELRYSRRSDLNLANISLAVLFSPRSVTFALPTYSFRPLWRGRMLLARWSRKMAWERKAVKVFPSEGPMSRCSRATWLAPLTEMPPTSKSLILTFLILRPSTSCPWMPWWELLPSVQSWM
mmetsp:Transcript_95997/g.255024  ORF Transcript_95997/g.255024 Transcript_95997/m.255024 type:complete len:201 (-) Transcript_95997:434-1036(-)